MLLTCQKKLTSKCVKRNLVLHCREDTHSEDQGLDKLLKYDYEFITPKPNKKNDRTYAVRDLKKSHERFQGQQLARSALDKQVSSSLFSGSHR